MAFRIETYEPNAILWLLKATPIAKNDDFSRFCQGIFQSKV